ncbi:MAG: FAD-dependent monooxygenase [Pseudorhodobacter sp.]|nr:FAD-dependent monooxygenase [Rhizobacter sp.]
MPKSLSAASDFDAVVIGAGPAGSSVAILLARAGWSVALVEKQVFPRRKVCGECIAATNWPLLNALGVSAERAGAPLQRTVLMRGNDSVSAALPAAAHPDHPGHAWGRALGRETLDTLLVTQASAAGVQVFQPCSVREVNGTAGAWEVKLRPAHSAHDITLQAKVAIAAHGSWEALPSSRARRRRPHLPSDLFAFKANFRGAALAPGSLPVLAFQGGYGGMVVADDGITTLACCIRRDALDAFRSQCPSLRAGDAVQALLMQACAGVREALRGATRDGVWLASGPIAPGIRLRESDAMFRVGNAAGEAHPIIGEGMSMALQSAWMLSAELLGSKVGAQLPEVQVPSADTQALMARRYAIQWRREFSPRMRLAAAFAHVAMRPALSRWLLWAAKLQPGLLTWGARLGGKVRCAADAAHVNAVLHDRLLSARHSPASNSIHSPSAPAHSTRPPHRGSTLTERSTP